MDTYKATVKCSNCGKSEEIDIPKGVKIGEQECSNCGCRTVGKAILQYSLTDKKPMPDKIWMCNN